MKNTYLSKKIIQFILIEMLYKKYVIEVTQEQEIDMNIKLSSTNTYENQVQMNLISTKEYFNIVRYVDNQGIISDYPTKYDTYNEAYNKLSTFYYNLMGNSTTVVRITEILDDMTPPVEVLRSMKINQILK